MTYFRPLVQPGANRPGNALPLAGGPLWFSHLERISRSDKSRFVPASALPEKAVSRLTQQRKPICGIEMDRPRIMGILNVTPDSFSDGGLHDISTRAAAHAIRMEADGADFIDIGGESTRPGAREISVREETGRILPVLAILHERLTVPISVDTRKAPVAEAAVHAGARLVNDVSGNVFDPALAVFAAKRQVPVCVMHSGGIPQTMQHAPRYSDVLLDVYDFLERQVSELEALGLSRDRIIIDPGIGFGKTQEHNLALLRGLGLFHSIGCAILLGVSRKRFIGDIGKCPETGKRVPGSIAAGLAGVARGAQILRVHDVLETTQALRLWRAIQ